MDGGLDSGWLAPGGPSRLSCVPSLGGVMGYQAVGAMMPEFGDVAIGILCRGGLGGEEDEQA